MFVVYISTINFSYTKSKISLNIINILKIKFRQVFNIVKTKKIY